MIAVLDYGAGNLSSVSNSLRVLDAPFAVARTSGELALADRIVLPGVGHFGQMMSALDEMQLREPLIRVIRSGVPFLGICLGMQALFEGSDEAPEAAGLGIFPGRAIRFPGELRVPHMGWNQVRPTARARLLQASIGSSNADPFFYFAHSYYVPLTACTVGETTYSLTYSAAIQSGSVFGVQFHPEKSAAAGQALIQQFLKL